MPTTFRSKENLRLAEVPLGKLVAHPLNPNVMPDELLTKLGENIKREADYPPLVVRPHPQRRGRYQVLDGHQRVKVLEQIGATTARVYVWPCSDADADLLVATLNRLHGEDQPARRAALLKELLASFPQADLATLVPESERDIDLALAGLDPDLDRALAEMEDRARSLGEQGPCLISFVVERADEELILRILDHLAATLKGPNRRGRALALVVREHAANKGGG